MRSWEDLRGENQVWMTIKNVEKPTAQTYFEKKFQNPELEWKDIYTLPRRVTINPSKHFNVGSTLFLD